MTRFSLILISLILVACTSAEERAQAQQKHFAAACTKAGYQPKTPAYDDCVAELKNKADQRVRDRVDAIDGLQQVQSNRTHTFP